MAIKPHMDWAAWLEEHGDYLFAYAKTRLYDDVAAEDLVQETLLAAWKGKGSFKGNSSVKTWLTSILRRKIIDHYRAASRKQEVSWEDFKSPFKDSEPNKGHWLESRAPQHWDSNPHNEIENKEFLRVLEACLDDLPPKWQAAFTLRLFEDMKTEELCKELDVSSSNLWVLIHRAKVKLRECLEINWFKE